MKCCICGKVLRRITGEGNNPWPVRDKGECCDMCNMNYVVPARIEMMTPPLDGEEEEPDEKA